MTRARPHDTAREWLWIPAVILALGAVFALLQPPVKPDLAHDGSYYLLMAEQMQEGRAPETISPFVLRVGTPWLAGVVARAAGASISNGFFAVNVLAGALTAWLFSVWLRPHIPDFITRVTLVVLFVVLPYSPFRFTFYYPTLTDSVAMLFLLMGLILLDRMSARLDAARAILMALIVAVGCVFRELVLAVAIAAVFVRPWPATAAAWLVRAVPLLGITTIAVVRSWVVITPSRYEPAEEVWRWLEWKTLSMMVLAVLFVFGPLIVVLGQRWRSTWTAAIARPDLTVFVAIFAAAGWLGASDTERIFVFATPVVLMQIGKTLADIRVARGYQAFGMLVALQLVACRALWPIGGPLLPLFSEHFSYFSVWLDQWWRMFFLVIYAVAAALIIAIVRSAPRSEAI